MAQLVADAHGIHVRAGANADALLWRHGQRVIRWQHTGERVRHRHAAQLQLEQVVLAHVCCGFTSKCAAHAGGWMQASF